MLLRITFAFLLPFFLLACSGSDVEDLIDDAEGIIDSFDEPDRKPIDTARLGVNAFANDGRFGGIRAQFREVRDVLRLGFIRVLFRWDDNVQPVPGGPINFSFYDDIASSIPAGMDALVVVTGVPSWMSDSANWVGGNPRQTFVEQFLAPVAVRYGGNARIIGFQIWNEPNNRDFGENAVLDVLENTGNYVELISLGATAVRSGAPGKLVVNGATTSIQQNFPNTLNYNRALRDAGLMSIVDVFAVHYYGKQFERVVRDGGVEDFLENLGKVIWITESGEQGVTNQLDHAERTWPFLREEIPQIDRIYQYQFAEATPSDVTFGLRNLSGDFPVSDLYTSLRDRT